MPFALILGASKLQKYSCGVRFRCHFSCGRVLGLYVNLCLKTAGSYIRCTPKNVNCRIMDEKPRRKRDLLKKLNDNYRVVFIDDESLEEVVSFRLTMRKLYIIISTLFVLVAVATVAIVVLTPVKYYIPGYAGGKTRLEVVKLKQNVDSLSDLVAAQEKYQENIRNVISGNMKTPLDTTLLDLKKTRQEEINSLLPASGELMKQAARSVKKDKEKAGK